MNSCRNERNIETGNYPIVEIKMILIQPVYLFCHVKYYLKNSI